VRAQALKLGDEANAKSRYTLAEGYYGTADAGRQGEGGGRTCTPGRDAEDAAFDRPDA